MVLEGKNRRGRTVDWQRIVMEDLEKYGLKHADIAGHSKHWKKIVESNN